MTSIRLFNLLCIRDQIQPPLARIYIKSIVCVLNYSFVQTTKLSELDSYELKKDNTYFYALYL